VSATVNRERINDTAKLIMHRLIAHQLMRDPSLVEHARQSLVRMAVRFPEQLLRSGMLACRRGNRSDPDGQRRKARRKR
jgi:hypothetical protein